MERNIAKKTVSIALFVFTLGVALTASGAAWARAHKFGAGLLPLPFSACGTLVGSNTIYTLTGNISTASTGNCIVLSGSNNIVNLKGFNITGPGGTSNGDGIKITGNNDVIEGFNSTISGFKVGVLDAGSTTFGDLVNMQSNGIGLEMTGGAELWTNFAALSNTVQGAYLNSCSDECEIADFQSANNGGDGVLVTGSDGARIDIFNSANNGGAGVHVGCASIGEGCPAEKFVHVGDGPSGVGTAAGVQGNGGDGVFLDISEALSADSVFIVRAAINGGFDLHDATLLCGLNQWVQNSYSTAEAGIVSLPACILPSAF